MPGREGRHAPASQKYLSGLCAAALLLSLLLAGTAKADEITIYLMAENDQMLDLPLSAMPAWINGDIYVPYTAFDWTVTGVNLGVSYGQERTETEYKFTLYSLNGMLVFDLNAGTCTDGFSRRGEGPCVPRCATGGCLSPWPGCAASLD